MSKSFPLGECQQIQMDLVSQITLLAAVCCRNHYVLIIFVLGPTKFWTNFSPLKKYQETLEEKNLQMSEHKSQKKQLISYLSSLSCLYVQLHPDFNCSCYSSSAFPSAPMFVKVSSGKDRSTAIPSICRSSLHSCSQKSRRQWKEKLSQVELLNYRQFRSEKISQGLLVIFL